MELRKKFLKFVLPSIASMWAFSLYTMVDGVFVARGVGETAMAAVNLSAPFALACGKVPILKELAAAVVGKLATIARLGRSVGINLIIGVQRADANTVPGQIKSNISGRVCGVADDVLSQIVLGNTDADKLPKHGRGLFLNQDGVMFRGYLPMEVPRPKAPSNQEGGTNEHPNP